MAPCGATPAEELDLVMPMRLWKHEYLRRPRMHMGCVKKLGKKAKKVWDAVFFLRVGGWGWP